MVRALAALPEDVQFDSKHLHGGLQPWITPDPGALAPSSGLHSTTHIGIQYV